MSSVERPTRRIYWAVFCALVVLGTGLRVWLAANAVAAGRDAARYYLPEALALSRGDFAHAFHPGIPPLYATLGGLVGRLVGDVEVGCRIVSLLAGIAVIGLVFGLARRLFGAWPALLAAGLTAFHPFECRYSGDVVVDMLAGTLVVAVAWLVVEEVRRPALWKAAATGAALAALALTRAEGLGYAPLAALVIALRAPAGGPTCAAAAGRRWFEPKRVLHAALVLAVLLVLCLPRLAWVHQRAGYWVIDIRQVAWVRHARHAVDEGDYDIGQAAQARRLGGKAWAKAGERLAVGLGVVALPFAGYALWRRRRRLPARCAQAGGGLITWIPGFFILGNILLILVGNRILQRYVLGAAALTQVWGGLGMALLAERLARGVRSSKFEDRRPDSELRTPNFELRRRARGLYLAFAAATALQVPWAAVHLYSVWRTERDLAIQVGHEFGPGQRILSTSPVFAWYARGTDVEFPTPGAVDGLTTPEDLAAYAAESEAGLVVLKWGVDEPRPVVLEALAAHVSPCLRLVHEVKTQHNFIVVLAVVQAPRSRSAPGAVPPAFIPAEHW